MKKYLILILAVLAFSSCEDVIEMEVRKGKDALVVEGWITDQSEGNYVKLYLTVPYFDEPEYSPVRNALVKVSDDAGNTEILKETSPGKYAMAKITGEVGRTYKLTIEAGEGTYEASAKMQRLSWTIDSVTYEYKDRGHMSEKAGFFPKIYGQELEGAGDYIRLKISRNGQPLQSSMELNLFNDQFVDGNYIKAAQPSIKEPFQKNDRVRYEMWSLSEEAYQFWSDIKTQMNNGGLFAAPGSNTRTNVVKINPNSLDVVGYFGASQVKVYESVLE